jgi:putative FmdB family regulatory protein
MPTYEYECTKCGHRFEIFQRMTDAKLEKCPKCGGKVERLIGPGAGIVFKGSGFYQTDYRSSSYKEAAKSESGAGGSKSESTGSGSTTPGKADPPKKTPSESQGKPESSSTSDAKRPPKSDS